MNLLQQLHQLKLDIDEYYETTFENDEEDTKANRFLKNKIKELIVDAHNLGQLDVITQALDLLQQSTGCAEACVIFINIADELVSKNIVSNVEIKKILENSPANRWF